MPDAKVSAALGPTTRRRAYISVLRTGPTMGGVAAAFALQGDITLAEPGALIGFAGKRTIWNTVDSSCPKISDSEFPLQHGFVGPASYRERTCAPKSLASSTSVTI